MLWQAVTWEALGIQLWNIYAKPLPKMSLQTNQQFAQIDLNAVTSKSWVNATQETALTGLFQWSECRLPLQDCFHTHFHSELTLERRGAAIAAAFLHSVLSAVLLSCSSLQVSVLICSYCSCQVIPGQRWKNHNLPWRYLWGEAPLLGCEGQWCNSMRFSALAQTRAAGLY